MKISELENELIKYNNMEFIVWCIEYEILQREISCPKCNAIMKLEKKIVLLKSIVGDAIMSIAKIKRKDIQFFFNLFLMELKI